MFGTLRLPKDGLDAQQYRLYRGHFCGLCHSLDSWGGKLTSLLTNYDMTFFLLVLAALEENRSGPLPVQDRPCTALLWRSVPVLDFSPQSRKLVAALSLALVGAKVDDDTQDGDRPWARWVFWPLRPSWQKASALLREIGFPYEIFSDLTSWQGQLEQQQAALEQLCAPTQHTLGTTFAYLARHTEQPQFENSLEELGRSLGLWIYLYDAWTDRERDQQRGSFNALLLHPQRAGEVRQQMLHALDHCARALSQLPLGPRSELLERHIHRLRSLTVYQVCPVDDAVPSGPPLACWVGAGALALGAGAAGLNRVGVQDCDCNCDCGGCDGCDCGCHGCNTCDPCHGCGKLCDLDCCDTPTCQCLECGCETCDCCSSCNNLDCCCISSTVEPTGNEGGGERARAQAAAGKGEEAAPGARRHSTRWRWPWQKEKAKKPEPTPEVDPPLEEG